MEKILCAAIWYNDGKVHTHSPRNIKIGFVVSGWRHHNCIGLMADFGIKSYAHSAEGLKEVTQGFITSKGDFVSRKRAAILAFQAKQIKKESNSLFSEDLY